VKPAGGNATFLLATPGIEKTGNELARRNLSTNGNLMKAGVK
jgi:hypothetical protein